MECHTSDKQFFFTVFPLSKLPLLLHSIPLLTSGITEAIVLPKVKKGQNYVGFVLPCEWSLALISIYKYRRKCSFIAVGLCLCQAVWVFLGAKLGRAGVMTSLLCISSQCFMQLFWPTCFTKASPSYATLLCYTAVCSLPHEPWPAKATMHCQTSTLTEATSTCNRPYTMSQAINHGYLEIQFPAG